MSTSLEENNKNKEETGPSSAKEKQERSDPQLTELKGFVDPSVDLEPTLSDGTKSPDKASDEYNNSK